jgi:endonuclease/exonuclease/phosphatase family metal-dependent hydrolase/regulation of enolase protein 1 (concanavalin A-like superfamily)
MDRRVALGVRVSWLVLAACVFAAPLNSYGQSLPSGWATRDIGSVGASGAASGSGGSFTVRGSGADIWGTADGFRFAYRQLTGDGEIVTRVDSVDYVHAWTKAGVMMRESLDAGARHAFMLASAGKGTAFQRRSYPGSETSNTSAGGGAGYFLKIARSGNNFDASLSYDGSNWSWVGSEWIDMPATIYVGVAVTSHYYGALAGAAFSNTAVNALAVAAPASGGGLPSGWANGDIGSVAAGGWAEASGTDVRLNGSGRDIWDYSDEFQYMYRTLSGDGTITARVTGLDYNDAWTKAGVMMRGSLSASSVHAFALVSAGSGIAFQRRTSDGGGSTHTAGPWGQAPAFVRLTRSGNTFTAYTSHDGSNWSTIGSQYIAMGSTIYVGLAVTSHADGTIAAANFSNLEVVQGVISAPAAQPTPVYQEPAPIYQSQAPSYGGASLRVLHWNVRHGGTGTDGVRDPERLARWIAYMNPDVASLNEVDGEWHLDPIVAHLQALTGVPWYSSFAGVGNVIVSRIPFSQTSICNYNDWYPRNAAHASVVVGGRTINFFSSHLDASSSSVRASEVYALQGCASSWGGAAILAGDYNMQSSSYEYAIAVTGYTDGWLAAKSLGTAQNYSGNCDGCTRNSRIDYVFANQSAWYVRVTSAQVVDTRDSYGYMPSDHKPLLVTFAID